MKRCPYCGAEYPDDALVCTVDREPLPENVPQPPPAGEQIIGPARAAGETAGKNVPYLTFPDYRWSARDAWKCLGMLLVFGFVLGPVFFVVGSLIPSYSRWHGTGFGFVSVTVLHYGIALLTAAYFARTETLATFWKGFGLDRKPSQYVWFGVTMALIIRGFGHFMIILGWGKGFTNYEVVAFKNAAGPERYLFLAPLLLLAPLIEESVNRGFLYKAFRGSYSIATSMVFILAWTAYTHWSQYHRSWTAAVDLSMLTIVQCYLREKSDSLWDCIFCHFAFNFSLLFVGGTLR